jgi:hypothetical protein
MSRPSAARALRRIGPLACLIACAPAAPDPAPPPTRVGFWNVQRLGLTPGKDVALLCSLALSHFDVLGLVELMAEDATDDLRALRTCLEAELVVLETERPSPPGSPYREHAWLALRPGHARPCSASSRALEVPPATSGFARPPAFACVELAWGQALVLGVYHARWGTGEPADVAREVVRLPEVMRAAGAALAPPASAGVWLLGDLNLQPGEVAAHAGLAAHTKGGGSTLGPGGAPTAHLYDQLLVAPGSALSATAHVLDLREAAGGPEAYRQTLSDHLPIVVELARPTPRARGQAAAPMP